MVVALPREGSEVVGVGHQVPVGQHVDPNIPVLDQLAAKAFRMTLRGVTGVRTMPSYSRRSFSVFLASSNVYSNR